MRFYRYLHHKAVRWIHPVLNGMCKDMFGVSANVSLNIDTLDNGVSDGPRAVQFMAFAKNLLNKVVVEFAVGATVREERKHL